MILSARGEAFGGKGRLCYSEGKEMSKGRGGIFLIEEEYDS